MGCIIVTCVQRIDEHTALKAAFQNAVNRKSAPPSLMDKVPASAFDEELNPEYPDHARDPHDRRKHLRCGHLRYVSSPDIKNSTKALVNELKLVNEGVNVGMNLTRIFTVLFGHMDQPMKDHISGVRIFYKTISR